MAQEKSTPGKVLFVDDEHMMRHLMAAVTERVGFEDLEIYDDAEGVISRMLESDQTVAGIISDGLNGGWKGVVAVARESRIPAVVLTGDNIREEVEAAGATFLAKPADIDVINAILVGFQLPVDGSI